MKEFENEHRSLRLSQMLVLLFGGLMVAMDATGPWLVRFVCFNVVQHSGLWFELPLLLCLYVCSIPAYVTLVDLFRLLGNIQKDQVFVEENVRRMRRVSFCCGVVAVVCLLCSVAWISLLVVALAAAFMALLVRVIKNVFVRAIRMKDELDLTI